MKEDWVADKITMVFHGSFSSILYGKDMLSSNHRQSHSFVNREKIVLSGVTPFDLFVGAVRNDDSIHKAPLLA
ncbi:MAG: hypothetical protein EBY80_15920 [Actinobacteria bacterium]|nr:hypothetical protein [Actinomycetota bacterium]